MQNNSRDERRGGGGTPYKDPFRKAPPKRRLRANKGLGILQVEVYERMAK